MCDEATLRDLRKQVDSILERHPELRSMTNEHDLWNVFSPSAEQAWWDLQTLRERIAVAEATA